MGAFILKIECEQGKGEEIEKKKKNPGNLDPASKQHQPESKTISEKDGCKASSGSLE